MFLLSDLFRQYLIVFLEVSFAALGVPVRLRADPAWRRASWREQREQRLRTLYQPVVDAVLASHGAGRVSRRRLRGSLRPRPGTCRTSARC